jgi:hypothetical protein
MGRYAFFSTDVEYKFAFGIQASQDILMFGGDFDEEKCEVTWSQNELPSILDELEHFPYTLPNFDNFEKNFSGTYELKNYIIDNHAIDYHELFYRFLLGCLVYHQLSYTPNLIAHFEY